MAFIGNTVQNQGFVPAVDYFTGNGSTTAFTLSRPVASVAQVEAVIENVVQNPGSAFTVSGNTITFASAPPVPYGGGSNNIYIRYTSPITQVNALSQAPSVIGPMSVGINGAVGVGGTTNPIINMSGASTNYVQAYVNNTTNGGSSSADLVAYPSNGTDAHGWVDMGITSQGYNDTTYTVTGPNESYLFGSAPSGSSTTGNLVYATDNTGTQNAHQFYVGGFTQAKSAYKFAIESTGAHGQLIQGTAQASTSGTSITFSSIPSWVKRITVMFNGVSTSGTSNIQIQIGSGSTTTTGYISGASSVANSGSTTVTGNVSTGFLCTPVTAAANTRFGAVVLTNITNNTWVSSGNLAQNDNNFSASAGVSPNLSGALDRVVVTTVNGTDTFDAGSINILWEG